MSPISNVGRNSFLQRHSDLFQRHTNSSPAPASTEFSRPIETKMPPIRRKFATPPVKSACTSWYVRPCPRQPRATCLTPSSRASRVRCSGSTPCTRVCEIAPLPLARFNSELSPDRCVIVPTQEPAMYLHDQSSRPALQCRSGTAGRRESE